MVEITFKQKILLVMFGLFLFLIFLECGLRTAGFVASLSQYFENKAPEDTGNVYHILCLGESTTAGGEDAWPSQLEMILNKESQNIKFKVFNGGVGERTRHL